MPRRIPNVLLSGAVVGAVLTVVTTAVSALFIYIEIHEYQYWIPSKYDSAYIVLLFGPAVFWAYYSPGVWFFKNKVVLEYHQHRNRGTLKREEITGFYLEDKNGVRLHYKNEPIENAVIIFTLKGDKTRAYTIQKLTPKKMQILNEELGRGHLL